MHPDFTGKSAHIKGMCEQLIFVLCFLKMVRTGTSKRKLPSRDQNIMARVLEEIENGSAVYSGSKSTMFQE